ncbi:MAG: hypothetical protein V2A79_06815 [Planctomycetota bacterium]
MKTERRQELKTNELAVMLEAAREFFRKWGSYLLGAVVVIILGIAFVAYRAKAAEQQLSDAWQSLSKIRQNSFLTQSGEKRTDAEIQRGLEGLQALADETKDVDLLFEILASRAQIAMQLSSRGNDGVDLVYLDEAERAYHTLKERLPNNPLAAAIALNGAANIEADRFVADGAPTHKENARDLLEQLRDDPRFANTPFQRSALDRLNRLDEVFRRVALAPAPKPMPMAPLEGPPAPTPEPTITVSPTPPAGVDVKRVPAPPPREKPAPTGQGPESTDQ